MGYIIVLVVGGIVLVAILVAFLGGKRRAAGRVAPYNDVTPKNPEAETLNPAASTTASPKQADTAQRHTPPA